MYRQTLWQRSLDDNQGACFLEGEGVVLNPLCGFRRPNAELQSRRGERLLNVMSWKSQL